MSQINLNEALDKVDGLLGSRDGADSGERRPLPRTVPAALQGRRGLRLLVDVEALDPRREKAPTEVRAFF